MIANPDGGNLLQSASFAKVKADYGWKPRYIVYEGTVDRDGEKQPFASYSLAVSYTHLTLPTNREV